MIGGVVFDMDGVLIDSMGVWEHLGENYLKDFGIEPEAGLNMTLCTMSMEQGASYLKEHYNLPLSEKEIREGIIGKIRRQYEENIPAKKGAHSFLEQLKIKRIPIALATSNSRGLAEMVLKRLDLYEFFDCIVTCDDCGASKQDPAIYFKASEKMNAHTGNIWVFEDALHGIITAKNAGFCTVGIHDATNEPVWKKIQQEATLCLESLTDFNQFFTFVMQETV